MTGTGMNKTQLKYKRLVLVVTQDQETVAKLSFDKKQLLLGSFLEGQRVFVKNVASQ